MIICGSESTFQYCEFQLITIEFILMKFNISLSS